MTKAEQAAAKWSREYRVRHSQKDSLAWRYPLDEADLDSAFLAGAAWQREEDATDFTYRADYSPNCPSRFRVSVVGRHQGTVTGDTQKDAVGYGDTLQDALAAAIRNQQEDQP